MSSSVSEALFHLRGYAEEQLRARSYVAPRVCMHPELVTGYVPPRQGAVSLSNVGARAPVFADFQSPCDPSRELNSIFDAMAYPTFRKRLLVLGEPGTGKTTTLLALLASAAQARETDPTAPIPVLAPLQQWDCATQSFAEWLATTEGALYPGIDFANETRLYLLDGLDDLPPSHRTDASASDGLTVDARKMLLHQLPEATAHHQVVLTSRIQPYLELGERAVLDGAVRILPFENAQIEMFLALRKQPNLQHLLRLDENANALELARTPLLLTIFSAIAGEEDRTIALSGPESAVTYDRMISEYFRHETEKRRQAPRFVPLPFTEETTRAFLEKIAACMWIMDPTPRTELSRNELQAQLGSSADAFLPFAVSMHLLRRTDDRFAFVHTPLRYMCAVPGLIDALKALEAWTRRQAASALGAIGDRHAVPALTEALNDPEFTVRSSAAMALEALEEKPTTPELLSQLNHSDASLRAAAVEVLGVRHVLDALPALFKARRDPDASVRANAEWALEGFCAVEAAVVPMARVYEREDADGRRRVVDLLGKIGACGIPPLLHALRDPDDRVKARARRSLYENAGAAMPLLIQALQDPDCTVREQVIRVVGSMKTPQVLALLLTALTDPDRGVSAHAAQALRSIDVIWAVPDLVAALKEPEPRIRQPVIDALKNIGVPALPALAAALKDGDAERRCGAAWALGYIPGPQAVSALKEALTDSEEDVREAALEMLQTRMEDLLAALLPVLGAERPEVRSWAARTIGWLNDRRAIPYLIHSLNDPNASVRAACISLLEPFADLQSLPALIAALKDADAEVRSVAATALGTFGGPQVLPGLIAALPDPAPKVTAAITTALTRIGVPAIPDLIEALTDAEDTARERIVEVLCRIGRPAVSPLLALLKRKDRDTRPYAAYALGRIGDGRSAGALLEALKDSDWNTAFAAAEALESITDSSAISYLAEGLKDKDATVRAAAANGLGRCRARQEVYHVVMALKDSETSVRAAAARALGTISDPQALPHLIEALKDPDRQVRCTAIDALGEFHEPKASAELSAVLNRGSDSLPSWIGNFWSTSRTRNQTTDQDTEVRISAALALGKMGDAAAEKALKRALKDEHEGVRKAVEGVLDQIQNAQERKNASGKPASELL